MKILRFQTGQRHIAFAHSFNSLIKNRIIMINKKPTRIFAALKNLFILPLFALAAMAFSVPKTYYNAEMSNNKAVKGVVLNEESKPMFGVTVAAFGSNALTATDQKGQFTLPDVPENASLSFEFFGFKEVKMAAEFSKEMTVHMQKDFGLTPTDFKVVPAKSSNQPAPLRIVDGVEVDSKTFVDPDLFFAIKFIHDKEATELYGEKGKNGVLLVTLKKK